MMKPAIEAGFIFIVVGETGFEPATPWSQTRCATGLRYSPIIKVCPVIAALLTILKFSELPTAC